MTPYPQKPTCCDQGTVYQLHGNPLIDKYVSITPYAIAIAYVWRSQIDTAFAWLQRAYEQRDAGIAQLQALFGISEMRKDPRYAQLLRKMNFPE